MSSQPTLTHRQMCELLQISRTVFYRRKAEGRYTHLESPEPNRYSREKTEAWIAGRSVHRVTLKVAS